VAAIIARFDVVAVQESRRNPKALKRLLAILGPQWRVIISDATEGSAGNGERLAFLYDSDRVQPSGLVGEIVLPPIGADPARQFARTPYTASFTRAGVEFTLASVHILWGNPGGAASGDHRLRAVDARLGGAAQRLELQSHGPGRLQPGPHRRPALRSVHLHGPVAAHRTEHRPEDNLDDDKTQHFYDQIAWFSKADGTSLLQGLAYGQLGGPFDFILHVYRGLTRDEVS
jgi:hypothetical protein